VLHGERVDAYLLSESSLFVYDDLIVLKTCGTTTLLHVVPTFLKLAADKCNATTLLGLWYSRKNMYKPMLQIGLHQNFQDEMTFLDKHLATMDMTGGAYMLGRLNGDHWHLYALDSPEWDSEVEMTFELLMSDLDQNRMKELFYCDTSDKNEMRERGKRCTKDSGIADLLEGVAVDESMFYPCGYSMNAVKDRDYFTIHVTPQPECSYASFETNRRYENYDVIISKVPLPLRSFLCFSLFLLSAHFHLSSRAFHCECDLSVCGAQH
jgi:S-adenosylmethionine decarboxylase